MKYQNLEGVNKNLLAADRHGFYRYMRELTIVALK